VGEGVEARGSSVGTRMAGIGAKNVIDRQRAVVCCPPDSAVRSGRPERRACAALLPFGCPWGNESNRPRPWKNAPCEVGAALCFPVVGSGVPADRLRAA
jgi:hypothetical protein